MSDIELVIKISEEIYQEAIKSGYSHLYDKEVANAVANGSPLPKGHGRLIDADEAIQRLCGKSCCCTLEECGYDVPCFSVQRINSAQTIIEADREDS